MFNPKYNISFKLLENIKEISLLVAQLNGRHFPKAVLLNFENRANEISTYASTSIEGNPLSLTQVKRIIKTRPENIPDTEKEVLNYNKALEELKERIKRENTKLTLDLILKIQKTVTEGLVLEFNNGKLRKDAVVVNDPRKKRIVYLPPDHQEVFKLIKELLVFISKNQNKTDPLILAGIFHKQFVLIHPFMDGNGRTARLSTKVLLAKLGLNTFNLFSFENYYNRNITKYFQFVGEKGDYNEIKDKIDYTQWLEYFTDGIIDELRRVNKSLKSSIITPKTVLKDHHQIILDYVQKNGYITDRIYSTLVKRSKPSRVNDFNKLIDLGLIEREGKGKATIYKGK